MRRTLLLTHEYYPFGGGVARYCYNLFKNFSPEDYIVACDHPQVLSHENVIHIKLKDKFVWPSWFLAFFRVKKIVKQNKIELIFTPNILPLGTVAYLFYKLYKIPYIISLHGLDIKTAIKNKPGLTRKILLSAEKIVTNTQYTAGLIKDFNLAPDKIKVIYPSIDRLPNSSPQLQAVLREKYNIQAGDKVLLTVGRLIYRKGHDLVIKAISEIQQPNIKYLIVGHGEELGNLKKLVAEKKLDQRVIFCGQVTDQELTAIYQLAYIFVLPNRNQGSDVEGFGMVFLEAAGFSLPIIAGRSGGVVEILTDKKNALLVESDDYEGLKSALTQLLTSDKLAQDLGHQALARSHDFLSDLEQSKKLKDVLS